MRWKKEEGASIDTLSRATNSIAKLKEANNAEFQNLHQRLANVLEEKQRKLTNLLKNRIERLVDRSSEI